MGSEVSLSKSTPPQITLHAIGTDRIRKVEIISNNEDVRCLEADNYEIDFEWVDRDFQARLSKQTAENSFVSYYYVRLTQVDGEMAWSSPIWLQIFS